MRLNERLKRLEGATGGEGEPGPTAAVRYGGPRDPVAVVRALGLQDMEELSVEVWPIGVDPALPPELAAELTTSGRHGQTEKFREFSNLWHRKFPSGEVWGIFWRKGEVGFVHDASDPELFSHFDCTWSDQ